MPPIPMTIGLWLSVASSFWAGFLVFCSYASADKTPGRRWGYPPITTAACLATIGWLALLSASLCAFVDMDGKDFYPYMAEAKSIAVTIAVTGTPASLLIAIGALIVNLCQAGAPASVAGQEQVN